MTAWLLLATLSFTQAADLDERLKNLIGRLGADSPVERERARTELGTLVGKNRRVLRLLMRDHLHHQKDQEVRSALIGAMIDAVEKARLDHKDRQRVLAVTR